MSIALRNYYVKAGSKFFEYADGHFHLTDRIPTGEHSLDEALRALEYAKTLSDSAELVRLTVTATPVDQSEIDKHVRESIRKKLEQNFSETERSHLYDYFVNS